MVEKQNIHTTHMEHNTVQNSLCFYATVLYYFNISIVYVWSLFHITRFLSSGSRHRWVNLECNEWESATNNFYHYKIMINYKRTAFIGHIYCTDGVFL